MKWQFDLATAYPGREKADIKRWPFALFDEDGKRLCQRTGCDGFATVDPVTAETSSYGEPIAAPGYNSRFKVRCRGPNDQAAFRSFWNRPWRKYYVAEFDQDAPSSAHTDPAYGGGFPMSDPMVLVKREISPAPKLWSCLTSHINDDGVYPSESIHFDERLDIDSSYTTFPQYAYRGRFSCRRLLVFEDISHDGEAYPDAVLRAPQGTEPPEGPTWRMRHKGNGSYVDGELTEWNPDSDIRFEPFSWPVPQYADLRRFLAQYWSDDPVGLPVPDEQSTGGEMFGSVTCQHIEGVTDPINARISGKALLLRFVSSSPGFIIGVPPGWKHTLLVDAHVWIIHEWIKASASEASVHSRYAMLGIYGRCVAIV